MAYQALYRQWRPATFSQVVGQEAIVRTLRHQVETGRIAHAYLFCGCRGTGKTTLAKIMSRAVNCEHPTNGEPCETCEVCKSIMNEATLDVVELDAASNNSVDDVRELLEQVRYPAQTGRYKVFIIDEVHMLSPAAFNALLKTLEEPPPHVIFILATTEPQKLPATILSRVQRYDFGRIPAALIIERMRLALNELSVTAEDEALDMVARAAEGAMRDAFSILDLCISAAADGRITAQQVREMLGSSDRDFLFSFARHLAKNDTEGVMRQIDVLMRSGREPQAFLREMTQHLRTLMTVRVVPDDAASLLEITREDEKRYRTQAEQFSDARLLRMLSLFMRAEGELRYASSPRVGLEVAALTACLENCGEDTTALLERVSEAEQKLSTLNRIIESGAFAQPVAAGKPAKKTSQAKPEAPDGDITPIAPAAPKPAPTNEQDIWKKALQLIAKTEPPLYGLLKGERFLGAEGTRYRLMIPFAKKDFTFLKLSQEPRLGLVSRALSEVAGTPLIFEPVLEEDRSQQKTQALRDSAFDQLVEAFGRDVVRRDDGTEAHT